MKICTILIVKCVLPIINILHNLDMIASMLYVSRLGVYEKNKNIFWTNSQFEIQLHNTLHKQNKIYKYLIMKFLARIQN